MVQKVRDRELEFVTYLRNNITDPSARGTSKTDTFSPTMGQTAFVLTLTAVKNVVSVTVAGVSKYIGYDYTVAYGEGTATTTVTLNTGATIGQSVVIIYKYGTVFIYEGFQRLDSELPRISIIPITKNAIPMSIGEQSNGSGRWIYYICNYKVVVRSRFANQLKSLSETAWNAINLFRQETPVPYNMVEANIGSITSEDFDNDLRLYECNFTVSIKWMVKFKD